MEWRQLIKFDWVTLLFTAAILAIILFIPIIPLSMPGNCGFNPPPNCDIQYMEFSSIYDIDYWSTTIFASYVVLAIELIVAYFLAAGIRYKMAMR